MNVKDYSKDRRFQVFMGNVMSFANKVNSVIKEQHLGSIPGKQFDLTPKHDSFEHKWKSGKTENIKLNSLIPTPELFSLAMDLVYPAIEEFEASNIFDVDTSFMPGAIVVGFDVLSYQGEARFTSRGVEKGDIPKADVSAGRTQQVIGKLDTYVSATTDEIQELAVRNNAGLAPMISLMSEKLEAARLLIGRGREKAIWNGAKVKGQDIGIDGWFSKFSTTASLYNAKAPTVGKQATVATKESAVTWTAKLALASGKGAMYIMEDISDAIAYVERLKQYKVKKIIFPQTWMIKLSTLPYSAQNPTPIIAVLRNALPGVEFVGTTALDSAYNTDLSSDGFIVVDNDKKNFIIADPEPINFLPAFTGKDGTVEQVARMQTAGLMSKHVSAAAYYTGI